MARLETLRRRAGRSRGICTLCLVAIVATPAIVYAQRRSAYSPVSTFDAYGNARPFNRDRRRVGTFQNNTQRRALRGFQNQSRRQNRRGGVDPFLLPRDIPRFRPSAATRSSNRLFPGSRVSEQTREAYAEYGGFGRRTQPEQRPGDATAALYRRRMLIEATTLNAPIHRAMARNGTGYGLRSRIERTPFDVTPPSNDSTHERKIVDSLRRGVEEAYARTRTEAWSWFRRGEYRRASRAFETASMLDSTDDEALVGELASHWSLGAVHTAAAVLRELVRRNRNPFTVKVDLAGAYADHRTAQTRRINARLQAAPDDVNPQVAAIDVVVLWYLGDRHEAMLVGERIARRADGAAYAAWPAMMREAAGVSPTRGSAP